MAMDGMGLWGLTPQEQGNAIKKHEHEQKVIAEMELDLGPAGPTYVFFDIRMGGSMLPRMVFELFTDDTPRCCENFRSLCTGERGAGTKMKLHYQGQRIFKVEKGKMFCGGDGERNDGLGKGESIYGEQFDDDEDGTDKLKHDKRGKISFLPVEADEAKMAEYEELKRRKPNTRIPTFLSSIFAVHFGPAPEMDKKACVFGQLVQGFDALDKIEAVEVNDKKRPQTHSMLAIIRSGELDKKNKEGQDGKKRKREESESDDDSDSSSKSSSSSSSSSKKKKKKKASKKKKKDKKDKKKDKKKGKKKKK